MVAIETLDTFLYGTCDVYRISTLFLFLRSKALCLGRGKKDGGFPELHFYIKKKKNKVKILIVVATLFLPSLRY